MGSNETAREPNGFRKVFDSRNRRVRGLWVRNGTYYAQMRVDGAASPTKIKLEHISTVPQATQELQALKKKKREGTLAKAPAKSKDHTLTEAIDAYKAYRDAVAPKAKITTNQENTSLRRWKEKFGGMLLRNVGDETLAQYAVWLKAVKLEEEDPIGGRPIDVAVLTLRHVLAQAVRDKWIPKMPLGRWKKMAAPSKEKRLITAEDLGNLCAAAIKYCPRSGRQFSDFLKLLAFSGGREQETLRLRWSVNVDFAKELLGFGQDGLSKRGAGSSQAGKPRWIKFHTKLKEHLEDMHKRKKGDWLFPSRWYPEKAAESYKTALNRVRKETGMADFTFHMLRHYFISHCVMAGVDTKQIAAWVNHLDGGVLIGRIYAHLYSEHATLQAAKLTNAF